jgi:hypothetical protein
VQAGPREDGGASRITCGPFIGLTRLMPLHVEGIVALHGSDIALHCGEV